MKKAKEAETISVKTLPGEEQRSIPLAALLFNTATLAGAVVACAMSGPKIPPWAGD